MALGATAGQVIRMILAQTRWLGCGCHPYRDVGRPRRAGGTTCIQLWGRRPGPIWRSAAHPHAATGTEPSGPIPWARPTRRYRLSTFRGADRRPAAVLAWSTRHNSRRPRRCRACPGTARFGASSRRPEGAEPNWQRDGVRAVSDQGLRRRK